MNSSGDFKIGNTAALKYDPKYINAVDDYIFKSKDRNFDKKLKVKLPTLEGFAQSIGVTKKTLYNWAENYEEFQVAIDKILEEQKQRLINNGLSGEYNAAIAKLILSSNHGMRERVDTTTNEQSINTFNDEQINRIADRISSRKGDDGDTSSQE